MNRPNRFMRGACALCCLAVLLAVMGLRATKTTAASAVRTVGVVDFYAPTPLQPLEGLFPELFAADGLSDLLVRGAADRITVVPRGTVRRAEASIGWRGEDVLRFGRLGTLARAIGADQLVIGWITMLNIDAGGNQGAGPPMADVSVVVMVFDAAQGRIVAETRRSASALLLSTPTLLAEQSIRLALSPMGPWFMAILERTQGVETVPVPPLAVK